LERKLGFPNKRLIGRIMVYQYSFSPTFDEILFIFDNFNHNLQLRIKNSVTFIGQEGLGYQVFTKSMVLLPLDKTLIERNSTGDERLIGGMVFLILAIVLYFLNP
jgi:hypothetical protein